MLIGLFSCEIARRQKKQGSTIPGFKVGVFVTLRSLDSIELNLFKQVADNQQAALLMHPTECQSSHKAQIVHLDLLSNPWADRFHLP